ncbi:AAA family ATPase [Patescibacteria group bacterium]|nr:AAA family ATPase [Patescibacteria group bacterium]
MYLEKLEIQGFKSFANPTTLIFNRDMTAIVGPNGSGKSNIADAVRWVLGEQSIKTLRGKKSEDVIFAGSDKKNKLGYAEVSLYLNNSDRQAELDYEQIVITRKIERSGESEYLINNNKVRLFDVQLLLAKANFGQKTYSVIGQGMIDSILVSSGQERKEFFDEATGVKQFQIKKNQAINKLEGSKENLEQSAKILAELDPRLRSLTRQVKRLEKREKLEEELKEIQTSYYSFLTNNINDDLKVKKEEFDKLQKEVADLNQELIDLQTQLDKEEKSSSRQDNFEILQKKLAQSQSELSILIKEKTILEGQADLKLMSSGKSDIVWLKARIEELKNQINNDKLILSEKQTSLKIAKDNLQQLEEKRQGIMEEFSKLENKLLNNGELSPEEMREKLEGILRKQISFQELLERMETIDILPDLKKACYQVTEAVNALFSKIKVSKEDSRKIWQNEFNKMLSSKDNLVAEISEARTRLAVLESEDNKIKEAIERAEQELKKLESDAKRLAGDKSDTSKQLEETVTKIEDKNKQLSEIEKQIQEFNKIEEDKRQSLVQAQKGFREVQANFNEKNSKLNEIKVELARLETRQEELEREIREEFSVFELKKTNSINVEESREKINSLKNQLSIIGGIDEMVLEEYNEVSERYNFLKEQSDDLLQAIDHLEKVIKDLEEAISKQFDKSFRNINNLFNQYFKKLFNGGKSELILDIQDVRVNKAGESENSEEENEEEVETKRQYGIEIKATPPGKRLASINMLSGGEKALTSIALICAIIANSPSPFVVLDEVDAALDEANSMRFAEILEELSAKTQFVAITHNRATMHKSKIIYGVTMGDDGVSKLLSMSFDQADEIAQ